MSGNIQTKQFGRPIAFKFVGGSEGELEGYASTFGGPADSQGDIVAPGAFAKSIGEHKSAGTLPAMLFSHDDSQPIGRWLQLREDGHGLFVKGRLTLEVPKAREVRALAADGAMSFSIGYQVEQSNRLADGRLLKSVRLFEISLVAMPANARARITSVKSAGADVFSDVRAFERFLRDAGASSRFAKAIISGGFKSATALRDASEDVDLSRICADVADEYAAAIRNIIKG